MTIDFTMEEKEYIDYKTVWDGVVDNDCPLEVKKTILEKVELRKIWNESQNSIDKRKLLVTS